MKEYLKAKKLLEGCSAKLGETISHLSDTHLTTGLQGAADYHSRSSVDGRTGRSQGRRSHRSQPIRRRDVVIGDSTLSGAVSSQTIDPFFSLDAVNHKADMVSESLAFNSYNEPATHPIGADIERDDIVHNSDGYIDVAMATPPASSLTPFRSEELNDSVAEPIDCDLSAYFADSVITSGSDADAMTFDIVDEDDGEPIWDDWSMEGGVSEVEPLLTPFSSPSASTNSINVTTSGAVAEPEYVKFGVDEPLDWGVDPKESLLIDPDDFVEVANRAPAKPTSKPRYRYEPQTKQYTSLGGDVAEDILFSDAIMSNDNHSTAAEEVCYRYPDESEALIMFEPETPPITILRPTLTEKVSPNSTEVTGDAPTAAAKPKPALFPTRKIEWENFPIKAHHLDQAGKATLSSASAIGAAMKPLPKAAARMVARPSARVAKMTKRALQRRSEAAVQRLVKSVERSKDSALNTIKDSFDLNQPCTGEFDKEGLGYNQAYISEHNFKAIVQLSSFSILILLCLSFTVNLWMNDEHGFGFRQQIIRDLAMITAETAAIEQENNALNQQIETLRTDDEAVESMVRYELGMIKPDEIFIRIVD